MHFPVIQGPPTNLVVFNETTTTLNARWEPAPGRVQNYRITYVPTAGGRTQTVSNTTDSHTYSTYSALLEEILASTGSKADKQDNTVATQDSTQSLDLLLPWEQMWTNSLFFFNISWLLNGPLLFSGPWLPCSNAKKFLEVIKKLDSVYCQTFLIASPSKTKKKDWSVLNSAHERAYTKDSTVIAALISCVNQPSMCVNVPANLVRILHPNHLAFIGCEELPKWWN